MEVPIGTTTVNFMKNQTVEVTTWVAMADGIEICTYHDYGSGMTGSSSTSGLEATYGVVCDTDPNLGYGVILFGNQETVVTK